MLSLPHPEGGIPGSFWRPNPLFIKQLADWLAGKRVLECFAGNGLLAAYLTREGAQVIATTRWSGHDSHHLGLYYPVLEREALDAVVELGPEADVLLMCWPTVTRDVLRAAELWGPDRDIIFIGEVSNYREGLLGGCATDEFFEAIERTHEFDAYKGNILEAAFVCRLARS